MMFLVFLLGFYIGGMPITAISLYLGEINAYIDEPRAKMLIWCIEVMLVLAWPIIVPIVAYHLCKQLKSEN